MEMWDQEFIEMEVESYFLFEKDKMMQSITEENNLSETAFWVPKGNGYHIRWFTPASEVDLCGHALLFCCP
ncbi:MAG: PhzF family phenazine biosynthesis protein [Deltaproteobacteria bacterium]|nr:PhzF family phenazine biosynthesis protein [Deltaproteobacteria bacterium]